MSSPQVSSSSASPLPAWQAEHKFRKHDYNPLRDPCLGMKVGFVALSILLIPLTPILALVKFGLYLREQCIIKWFPKHPLKGIREMKQTEELDKFQTMQNVMNKVGIKEINLNPSQIVTWINQLKAELREFDPRKKIMHELLKELNKKNSLDLNAMARFVAFHRSILESGEISLENIKGKIKEYDLPVLEDAVWQQVEQKVNAKLIAQEKHQAELAQFESKFERLLKILDRDPKSKDFDATTANREFIAAFRGVLGTSIYRQFKENSSLLSIQFLHRLAVAIWNEAPSMDAYMKVGENIAKATGTTPVEGEVLTGPVIAEKLKESHEKLGKLHYPAKGLFPMFAYAISHVEQTIGGLASEGMVPGMQYDGHGTLSNNPSLQGVTKIEYEGNPVTIHNCYGGSPTIGNHRITPEFKAMLQATENNQLAPEGLRHPKIPSIFTYHNFQNLDHKHGEGVRSRLLMLLQLKYPLSFRGMTLSKDSKLYLMRDHSGQLDPKWVKWGNAQQFRQVMLDQMNRSFDLKEKGHGFYFPGTAKDWEPVFNTILDAATDHFERVEQQLKGGNHNLQDIKLRAALQGAYQELVYALMMAHSEVEPIRILQQRGVTENVLAVLYNLCKENIDRGAMANMLYLYLRMMLDPTHTPQQKFSLLAGAMECRAISSRDRLILSSRMPQGLDFMTYVGVSDFQEMVQKVYNNEKLGYPVTVKDKQYSPHLPRKAAMTAGTTFP